VIFDDRRYRLLINRATFDACQDILNGRNRRTGNPDIAYSGGILRCAYCDFAMTGELIRRKLNNGGCNTHVYYRCGNSHPDKGHPKVRWREADIEHAIIREFEALRMPNKATSDWFRDAVEAAFDDVGSATATRRKMVTKRHTELVNMQDRLLNGYLAGTIDEEVFQTKSADLKSQVETVGHQLDEADQFDPAFGQAALAVFDFSQNLVPLWRGSNLARKREILEVVSLNRMLSDVSLVLTKRKPFDFLIERPFLKKSRGDKRSQ